MSSMSVPLCAINQSENDGESFFPSLDSSELMASMVVPMTRFLFIFLSTQNVQHEPSRGINVAFKTGRRTVSAQCSGSRFFSCHVVFYQFDNQWDG